MCGNTGHTFDECELPKINLENTLYPILIMQEAVETITDGSEYSINITD